MFRIFISVVLVVLSVIPASSNGFVKEDNNREAFIDSVLTTMTLQQKVGQMFQYNYSYDRPEEAMQLIREGKVGSLLSPMSLELINSMQEQAVTEGPNKIPLLFAADVIHGLRTVFPVPIGMASSWNPELIKQCARVAAEEASSFGVNWNYSPMVDIARDPRWGRIAEGYGEDPYLTSVLSVATMRGYQTDNLSNPTALASGAKHFAGYGAAEGGRDYNTTLIPENELRNIYLAPFKALKEAGVASYMSAFNDLNGVPCTANEFLLRNILKDEWGFKGMVVSDQHSAHDIMYHGLAQTKRDVAQKVISAGLDVEMGSRCILENAEELVNAGELDEALIDDAVRRILRVKYELGLFTNPYRGKDLKIELLNNDYKAKAHEMVVQSSVLLKNNNSILPLSSNVKSVALIGPYANNPNEMDGCWTPHGRVEDVEAVLPAFEKIMGSKIKINFAPGVENSSSMNRSYMKAAIKAAKKSDVILFFGGEHSEQTGENSNRANLDLPGIQEELLAELHKTGKPIVLVVFTGRPLILKSVEPYVESILYSWHTGIMGGPAITRMLFGEAVPSGKLPVTFPAHVGQIPIYYNHKPSNVRPNEALGNMAQYSTKYLDIQSYPAYPFGFGLSYTTFEYSNMSVSNEQHNANGSLVVTVDVQNTGNVAAYETAQLYIEQLYRSVTRPVKELKRFDKIMLMPGEKKQLSFTLAYDDFAFYNINNKFVAEQGPVKIFVGGNSVDLLEKGIDLVVEWSNRCRVAKD